MAQAVWGIDIGRSSLKAVKVQKVKDDLEILDVDRIEYGSSQDGSVSGNQVKEAVAEFLSRHKVKRDRVVVALPGHVAFTRFIKLPPVEAKGIEEIIRYEAQQQIPFPIDDVVWGYQVIGKNPVPGEEIEVGLFAIKKELVYGFIDDLIESGLEPDVLSIAPLAIYNFIQYDQDLSGSSVVLDIGHEHTDLVIVDSDRFWIRNLPLAGQDITKALQEKFKLSFRDAEKLKKNAAKSKQAQKLYAVFEPVLKDFVGEIHRSVGFYKSQARTAKFEDIYLLGGGTKVIGLKEVFSRDLRFRVHRINALNKISVDRGVDAEVLQVHLGSFAVALGLAVQGIGESPNSVNLMPREMIQKKEISRKKPLAAACLVLLLVWLLGLAVIKSKVESKLEVTLARASGEDIAPLRRIQADAQAEKDKFLLPQRQCEALVGLVKDRTRILKILDDLKNAVSKKEGKVGVEDVYVPQVEDVGNGSSGDPDSTIIQEQRTRDAQKVWLLEVEIGRVIRPMTAGEQTEQGPPKEGEVREIVGFEVFYQVRVDAAIQPEVVNNEVQWEQVAKNFDDRLTSEIKRAYSLEDNEIKRSDPQDQQLEELLRNAAPRDASVPPSFVHYTLNWKVL